MRIPFSLSNESITVFAGGKIHTVLSGNKNFNLLKEHLKGDEHSVETIVRLANREENIRASTSGLRIEVRDGTVYYMGQEVHNALTNKLLGLMDEGFDAGPWVKFLDNLMSNPSYRSRQCLYEFLEHFNAPITEDGKFIAFKRVGQDFKDLHSRTYDNSVGKVIKMDRHMVDDDPQHTCSAGLHVCADEYLKGYANNANSRTLVVEVNPADVVAVPYDYNFSKMRVCQYKVLQEIAPAQIQDILDMEMYSYYDQEEGSNWNDVDTNGYDF
jgi:hypothetical protein